MTGLEKVTGKIIADAEADARATLAAADAECDAIRVKYDAQVEGEKERLNEQAERECAALITRAKSSSAMAKRNVVLEARSRLLDETYAAAAREIRDLPTDQYRNLLIGMLKSALRQQLASEAESMRLYGEDIAPAGYEIILNNRDRKEFGEGLIEEVRRGLGAKVGLTNASKVSLSKDTAEITGGLILRCGDVEINCSLAMLFAEVRRATEAKVSGLLFGKRA